MGWDELRHSVAACRACALCQERRQAVLGVGDVAADWLFIGEGPGAEEDARGEPFVGPAGKLLDAMLAAIDLQRGEMSTSPMP
jgi:uracil-DNA glycosylase family 4